MVIQRSLGCLRKFRKRTWLFRIFCICLSLTCFYIISHKPHRFINIPTEGPIRNIDPVHISKTLSVLKQTHKYTNFSIRSPLDYLDDEFDPNLPSLRERILKVTDSKSFSSPFTNPEALYSNDFESKLLTVTDRGSLNVYLWRDHCSQSIDLLKAKMGFPYNPWKKYLTPTLTLQTQYDGFGQRVFGYLIPPTTGEYSIEITFTGALEMWLSPNERPSDAVKQEFISLFSTHFIIRMLQRIVFGSIEQVVYILAKLVANKKHYIQILHRSSVQCELEVKWRRPQTFKHVPIESRYLCPYVNDSGSKVVPETYAPPNLLLHDPSPEVKQFYHPYDERNELYSLPTIDIEQDNWVFPQCNYQPSYVEKRTITNANGLDLVSTHPATHIYSFIVESMIHGAVISSARAESVLRIFMHHVTYTYPYARLSRLLSMERLADPINGDLFLIEVLITVDESGGRELLMSEYVVLGHKSLPRLILCQPTAMKIRRNTFVHFLVTHRNFPQMLREFVQNMERIYDETSDDNFGVILVNYESPQISVTTLMRQSRLKHWSIIEMEEPWEKTAAINLGIDSVKNPNDIIFLTDLSLYLPSHLPDSIRKHTFQGYSGLAPIVFYFNCDFAINSFYKGFYSVTGFGLVSLYKSDWSRVGGMDTTRFKGKWGWEDNDLANRILASGYVLFRLVMRDFYHQNHTYAGLWDVN